MSRCMLQNPSLASNLGKMVAPANLCEISLNVGALYCSLTIVLFKSLGSKYMA